MGNQRAGDRLLSLFAGILIGPAALAVAAGLTLVGFLVLAISISLWMYATRPDEPVAEAQPSDSEARLAKSERKVIDVAWAWYNSPLDDEDADEALVQACVELEKAREAHDG